MTRPDGIRPLACSPCGGGVFGAVVTRNADRAGTKVVDLLALHLSNARAVEVKGSHAHHIESNDQFFEALEKRLQAG